MTKEMTKKQLIDALDRFNDDDVIIIEDGQYHNDDSRCRETWIGNISTWSCGDGTSGPSITIESNELVETVKSTKPSCLSCSNCDKHNSYKCKIEDGEKRCMYGNENLYVFINEPILELLNI